MTTTEVGFSRDDVISACKLNLNFFAAFCIPDIFRFNFPPVFIAIWQNLIADAVKPVGQTRLVIGLPRGFGKTLLLKLYVVWLILYTDRKFILVVCNVASLAENFIADVYDILTSDNFIRVFGDCRATMEKDTAELKKFSFRGRPVILAGLGSGSSLRGLNLKFERPDVIISDDQQSREEAESPTESQRGLTWMLSTLHKANNKFRCQFIYVGNMYPFEGAIIKKLKNNPLWTSFICGAILADGESLWPQLRSVEDILEELENDTAMGHPEIFFAEVMNDEEAGNKAGIDLGKIKYWDQKEDDEPEAGFVIIDPSTGKRKSDAVAIGVCYVFDGIPVLWDVDAKSLNPGQQVQQCIDYAVSYQVMAVIVESVAYQSTLVYWLDQAKLKHGMHGLQALEIYPGASHKNSRIITMLKQLAPEVGQAQILLHPRVKAKVIYEITHWNPMRLQGNVDNILDVLAYLYPTIHQYRYQIMVPFSTSVVSLKAAFGNELELAF